MQESPVLKQPTKSTKKEKIHCNKPDPDTSSWPKTFLITNSCLWVTRPAAQHKAAQQLSVSLTLHFQERAFSHVPLHEHLGLLCKSNNYLNTGSTHPIPALITSISSIAALCAFRNIYTKQRQIPKSHFRHKTNNSPL